MDSATRIHVMAGVIRDAAGRVLVAQRPPGDHLGGLWEFPGGKCDPGESREEALVRELDEELGIRVIAARPLIGVPFDYPGKRIFLDVWRIVRHEGEPWSREGQALRWVDETALADLPMPAADQPVVTALRLPPCYLITPDWPVERAREMRSGIQAALRQDIGLIRLRLPQWPLPAVRQLAADVLPNVRGTGARLLASDVDSAIACDLDGAHLSGRMASTLDRRPLPHGKWLAVSCHGPDELHHAARIGADFVTLSPVRATASHPATTPMGWDRFGTLVRDCPLPVYALGGLGAEDVSVAQDHGAQGIAAIGRLWPA